MDKSEASVPKEVSFSLFLLLLIIILYLQQSHNNNII